MPYPPEKPFIAREIKNDLPDRLKSVEQLDEEISFKIENEQNENGELVDNVYWARLVDGKRSVEGKFFLSEKESTEGKRRLVIFEPGLPGDGVIIMDKRHAPQLVKLGYDVLNLRHNGTVLNSDYSAKYVHCDEKQKWAESHNQEYMGKPFSFAEWREEVLTAIKALVEHYDEIHLIGHSMGALNINNTLKIIEEKHPQLADKIRSVTSLSGCVGKINLKKAGIDLEALKDQLKTTLSADGNIKEEKKLDKILVNVFMAPKGGVSLKVVKEFLEYIKAHNIHTSVDPVKNISQLVESMENTYRTNFKSFKKTRFMAVAPTKRVKPFKWADNDEYSDITSQKEFIQHLDLDVQKNSRIVAYGTKADPVRGVEAHNFKTLPTSFLAHWLDNERAQEMLNKINKE